MTTAGVKTGRNVLNYRIMRSPMMLEKETFRKVKITKKEEMVMRREKSWQNVEMKVKIYKGRLKNNM